MAAPIGALPSPRISPAACRPSTASSARAVGPACVSQKKKKTKMIINVPLCWNASDRYQGASSIQVAFGCGLMTVICQLDCLLAPSSPLSSSSSARQRQSVCVCVPDERARLEFLPVWKPACGFPDCIPRCKRTSPWTEQSPRLLECQQSAERGTHPYKTKKKKRKRKQMIYRPQLVLLVFARHPAKLTTCESSRPKQMPRIKQERSVL